MFGEAAGTETSVAGPAVRRITVPEPALEAAEMATALDADLAADDEAATAAILARRPSARISSEEASELRRLAGELGRAMRVRARTEAEVTTAVVRRLSTGKGLAVHPSSVRAAAQAVVEAERKAAVAAASVADLGDVQAPAVDPVDVEPAHPEMLDEDAIDAAQTRTRAFGLAVAVLGLSLLLAGIGLVPWWGAAVGAVLAVLVALVVMRRGAASRADAAAHRDAADMLAVASATAERAAAAREASDGWYGERARLEMAHDQAEAEARAARRAWEALVGPGADPYDVEEVVRLRDPQLSLTGDDLSVSPTIRTVNAFQRRALARWRVRWAVLGIDPPPDPEDVDAALAAFGPPRPLVLVAPGPEVEAMVSSLPPDCDVVIFQNAL